MLKAVALISALLLVFGFVLAGPALALHAIQDEGRGTISLDAVSNEVPEQATGTARFRLSTEPDGFYELRVRVRVNSLPERAGRVYEAWLVDDETGYSLNLGAFNTDNDGDGVLTTETTINHLSQFDRVVVTTEDRDDVRPGRDGPVVLEGEQD